MTGFGLGNTPLGKGRIVVEIRTVNGKYLDVRVRMPREIGELTSMVESEARRRLSRGRCDIGVRAEGTVFSPPTLDKDRASEAYRSLVELRDHLAPGADVPFSMLSAVPDLFTPGYAQDFPATETALRAAVSAAIDDLELMRQREGTEIAVDLSRRIDATRSVIVGIGKRSPEVLRAQTERFRERCAIVEPSRLEQEVALLLERSDISEELTRLEIHTGHLAGLVAKQEPQGRRLDFLLQEMAREINTIGAKSQDSVIAHAVVELKAEIEKMREQVQNVE
jgi:uncharacterized protein (TIGR00255 family)